MTKTERRLLPIMRAMADALTIEAGNREIVAKDLRLTRDGRVLHLENDAYLKGGGRLVRFASIRIEDDGDEDADGE